MPLEETQDSKSGQTLLELCAKPWAVHETYLTAPNPFHKRSHRYFHYARWTEEQAEIQKACEVICFRSHSDLTIKLEFQPRSVGI